jgi:hypothetical protein
VNLVFVDTESMTTIKELCVFGGVTDVAMSPDGKYFATISGHVKSVESGYYKTYSKFMIWSGETYQILDTLEEQEDDICSRSFAFSGNSKYLINNSTRLDLYDVPSFVKLSNLSSINKVDIWRDVKFNSLSNKVVVTGEGETGRTIQTYSIDTGKPIYLYEPDINAARGIDVSRDDKYFLTYDMLSIKLVKAHWETTGIDDIDAIVLYPNPVNNIVNLNISPNTEYTIKVLDITGAIIHTESVFNQEVYSYNVEHLSTGTYFLQLISNNDFEVHKFIKE